MRVLAIAVALAALLAPVGFSGAASQSAEGLAKAVARQRDRMVRVTRQPYRVRQPDPTLCAAPSLVHRGPHGDHWIHVLVNATGRKAMETGQGEYPVGSLILKQKFFDALGKRTDFYTGMRKREPGYNPTLNDWEFFTLNATGKKITSQGKLKSCMDCHRPYVATDYVTRAYLWPLRR